MTTDLDAALATLAATLRASTVRVHDEERRGSGSGVVWNAAGIVVTNAHVVRGRSAKVEWESGQSVRAEVVRRDDGRDLAALLVPAGAASSVALVRASGTLTVGEMVAAVGNPLGLTGALTTGIVQRCNARWVIADVRLAPGNSGGPLADSAGRVVGINSMVAGGLALAVPSDAVRAFLGEATRRMLGVALRPVNASLGGRRALALLVTAVEADSLAERAGLLLGDAILGTQLGPLRDFENAAAALAGATTLEVVRGGSRVTVSLPEAAEGVRAA